MAFNAKNLEYNKQEPAFLRKLKGEFGGLDGRHNVQIARPKKDRLKTGDADEDEPVIVDEQGERIEKADFERRMKGEDEVEKQVDDEAEDHKPAGEDDRGKQAERQKVAEVGSSANSKKRKAGKVVVAGEGENDGKTEQGSTRPGTDKLDESLRKVSNKKDVSAPKKKGKKIKLSFDDPEV